MFHDDDVFTLIKPIPGGGVPLGARGVVLMVLTKLGGPVAYEVEFVDGMGNNIGTSATFTLTEEFMQKICNYSGR